MNPATSSLSRASAARWCRSPRALGNGVLLAALLATVPALAQEPPGPALGQRVRAWTTTARGPTIGTLSAEDDTHLVISGADGALATLPRGEVTRLQVSAGRRSRARTGALIGAAVGLGAALMFTVAECELGCDNTARSLLILTAGGGALGGLVAAPIRTERWRTVPVPRGRVGLTLAPSRTGVAVSVALRF